MLGSCFAATLDKLENVKLYAFGHEELDVTDFAKMKEKFEDIRPELVINCTAYTDVDEAEKNRDMAFKINAEAVGNMARLCNEYDATLIHFSTDYVFDGQNSYGYKENDAAGPINVYGESKLAGEKLIAENMEKFYLIRTSWMFGSGGKNFVETMLKLGEKALSEGKELKVVNDQVGSPTYTEDFVKSVVANFIEPIVRGEPRSFGIYHLANFGTCSWYEFAKKIFEIKKMAVAVKPVGSGEFPRPAKRPACSILLNGKTAPLRSWVEALEDYLGAE